ncbi:MAG: NUDIX hydrolase [Gemmatirosa sp.]
MSPVLASPRTRAGTRRSAPSRAGYSVDVVLLTVVEGQLAAALVWAEGRPGERLRERWLVPWEAGEVDESLGDAAERVARDVMGTAPHYLEQLGAFGDGRRHPGPSPLSVAYVGLVPAGASLPADTGGDFFPVNDLPPLAPRQRAMVDAAVAHVQQRVGQAPVAFRLLPQTFTLSELQELYELLLDRRLHKASFRRSLQAARIVEPTDEWRSEGRGRPAQLFRYAPKRRRNAPRGVRFE